MKTLGDEVFIQRGEDWSLDIDVRNDFGDPYMIFKKWRNPYMVITVTAARYAQKGDYRHTWWLDLSKRMVQTPEGNLELVPQKTFIATQALYVNMFTITDIETFYGSTIDTVNADADNYVGNYLFFRTPDNTTEREYRFLADRIYRGVLEYKTDEEGNFLQPLEPILDESGVQVTKDISYGEMTEELLEKYQTAGIALPELAEIWEEYNFRVVKGFDTKEWVEQTYLYDVKILSGESVEEHVDSILLLQGFAVPPMEPPLAPQEYLDELPLQYKLDMIEDDDTRLSLQDLVDSDIPLMPNYETKVIVMLPKKLNVSANIQEGL